jgi:hypothetical protein
VAESSAKRVVAVVAIASALVGAAVASAVAEASSSSKAGSNTNSSSGSNGAVTTAAVVRTNLITTVQVGGSIGFDGSYTVGAPSGTSAQQLSQAHQTVSQDQQAVAADETAASDAVGSDNQAIGADQANLNTATVTLNNDQAKETADCAGLGASTPACSQDAQKVGQDQAQLTQTDQQLATARSTATRDRDQNQARVASDETKLQGDETTLASLQTMAVNPGATFTSLPKAGDIIKQDQAVYSVSNEAVPLLYGSIAAYRAFYVGMSDGADVGQLTHDLIALGYGAGLAQSNHYTGDTATAVQRWQRALGLPVTGSILLGQVVFEPGPIRVTSVTPSVGSSVAGGSGGGTVLSATSTTPIVTVALDVTQEYLVKPGDAVSVVLPDGTSTVGGHVETVGNVATCPNGNGSGSGNGSPNSADQSPCSSSGSSSPPTVTVTIALDSIPPGASLDQAPVNVNITSERADNVLAVPVNALLALQGGGFGVDVVTGNTSHLVGVTTGLYSSTLVEISGNGIAAGTLVEVPSS